MFTARYELYLYIAYTLIFVFRGTQTSLRVILVQFWTYLLIPEAHLPTCVPGHVHTAEEHPFLVARPRRTAHQLGLNSLVVLLINDVIHAVPVYQQILLKQNRTLEPNRSTACTWRS